MFGTKGRLVLAYGVLGNIKINKLLNFGARAKTQSAEI